MSTPITESFSYGPAKGTSFAQTIYGQARARAGANVGKWWNGSSYENWSDSHWATYGVALVQDGTTEHFVYTLPSGADQTVPHDLEIYVTGNGSQLITDPQIGDGVAGDWLTLDAAIAAISGSGAGAGAKTCNLTLETSGNEPVGQALVWITTDSEGTDVIAGSSSTSDLGAVTFYLTPGTYYRFAKLSGYDFTNGQSFTVNSDATQAFTFTDASPVSAPSEAPIGTTQLTVVLGSRIRLPAAYEGAILGPLQILLVDPFGNAASMAGNTVKLVVYNAANADASLFDLNSAVDDTVTNQITFTGTTADTANVGVWRFTCANTTNTQVLFTGTLPIRDSASA